MLRDAAPVVLVEVEQRHRDGDVQEVFDYLAGLGYEGAFVRAGSLHPIDSFDVERDQLRLVSHDPTEVPFGEYVCDFLSRRILHKRPVRDPQTLCQTSSMGGRTAAAASLRSTERESG